MTFVKRTIPPVTPVVSKCPGSGTDSMESSLLRGTSRRSCGGCQRVASPLGAYTTPLSRSDTHCVRLRVNGVCDLRRVKVLGRFEDSDRKVLQEGRFQIPRLLLFRLILTLLRPLTHGYDLRHTPDSTQLDTVGFLYNVRIGVIKSYTEINFYPRNVYSKQFYSIVT